MGSNILSVWTVERTDQLRELFALGLSASQIAAQLGGVTRNAVIGKQNRLGLSRGGFIGPRLPRPKRPRKPSPSRWHLYNRERPKAPPKPVPVVVVQPEWRGISLFELTNETCRFPSHEAPFFYCGVPEADCGNGRPYCPYHHNITHQDQQWNRSRGMNTKLAA